MGLGGEGGYEKDGGEWRRGRVGRVVKRDWGRNVERADIGE